MRRRLAVLLTSAALALSAHILTASSASADPNPHSQHGQCTSAAAGLHTGWDKQPDGGRRNVGGTCPA